MLRGQSKAKGKKPSRRRRSALKWNSVRVPCVCIVTNVAIALHPEVEVTITLNIARSADEAERQAVSQRTRALLMDGLRPRAEAS